MTSIALCWHFLQRELRNRYLGSISGGLWALLQPLAQLAIYGFVWAYVFKQRAPGGDASPGAIVPFLAVGMWPWNAFSECMMRSTTVIQENSGLIGKVALPRPVLVIASAGASFILHGFGFIAIMLVLAAFGMKIHLLMLPIALLVLLQLFLLGLGFAFLFSAVQVFVRDLSQVLGQLIPLWMFLSPVLYSRDFLPEAYRGWLSLNPFTFYPEYLRSTLLGFGEISVQTQLTAFFVAVAMCAIGYGVFLRLNPRFEDFL